MANVELERQLLASHGAHFIAGLDEAGRGALAGPVVAAAVILPLDQPERLAALSDVDDSKRLTPHQRDRLYALITAYAVAYAIGSGSSIRIDHEGILPATRHAMAEAIYHLHVAPDYLLIDGPWPLRQVRLPQETVVHGDSQSLSIAAASIIAKVTRDRYMVALGALYPQYGFEQHKGYATPQHLAALHTYGPIAHHRHSFAPIKQRLL